MWGGIKDGGRCGAKLRMGAGEGVELRREVGVGQH